VLNRRKHRPADVPLVEADVSVRWADVRLCSATIRALRGVLAAFAPPAAEEDDSFTSALAASHRGGGTSSASASAARLQQEQDDGDAFEKSLTAADLQRFKEVRQQWPLPTAAPDGCSRWLLPTACH
jgi:hypothetical protein